MLQLSSWRMDNVACPFMHYSRPLSHILISLHLTRLDVLRPYLWKNSSSLNSIMTMIKGNNVSSPPLVPQTTANLGILWGQKLGRTSVKSRVTDVSHYLLNKWRHDWMTFQIIKPKIADQLPLQWLKINLYITIINCFKRLLLYVKNINFYFRNQTFSFWWVINLVPCPATNKGTTRPFSERMICPLWYFLYV